MSEGTQGAQAVMPSPSPAVLVTRVDDVLTLTMNRPDRLNALDAELATGLVEALKQASKDPTVRAIVLTGAGRGFCSGGDLKLLRDARARGAGEDLKAILHAGSEIVLTMGLMPKPVIAAVNGPAAGAGMNLALACDIRIASEHAQFAQSFARVGLVPNFGGTWLLPRLVGPGRAAELFMTGDTLDAEDAQRMGIVDHVVTHDSLGQEAAAMAARLAAAPPLVIRGIKKLLHGSHIEEIRAALREEEKLQEECYRSEDCAEGLNAYFEKRAPKFTGR
ncbi:MAG TPA: enoyl-CoA hydratase [Candidatus Acidoferrum sp.]|nr:enoyl-CoA hydratase [Candidatus Acidoferrum sp.]